MWICGFSPFDASVVRGYFSLPPFGAIPPPPDAPAVRGRSGLAGRSRLSGTLPPGGTTTKRMLTHTATRISSRRADDDARAESALAHHGRQARLDTRPEAVKQRFAAQSFTPQPPQRPPTSSHSPRTTRQSLSNRDTQRLEFAASRSKQTPPPISNRNKNTTFASNILLARLFNHGLRSARSFVGWAFSPDGLWLSNRDAQRLEFAAIPSKQTPPPISNRNKMHSLRIPRLTSNAIARLNNGQPTDASPSTWRIMRRFVRIRRNARPEPIQIREGSQR